MKGFVSVRFDFIKFWFFEAPINLVLYFISFNKAFLKLFSFFILVRTFFKPWKNEYRQGFVGFAILVGMAIKSLVIFFDSMIFLLLVVIEMVIVVGFIAWPLVTIGLLLY